MNTDTKFTSNTFSNTMELCEKENVRRFECPYKLINASTLLDVKLDSHIANM